MSVRARRIAVLGVAALGLGLVGAGGSALASGSPSVQGTITLTDPSLRRTGDDAFLLRPVAYRNDPDDGGWQAVSLADDDAVFDPSSGAYTLSGLDAGTYRVCLEGDDADPDNDPALLGCYGGSADPEAGADVKVASSAATGRDFATQPMGLLAGTVTGPGGEGVYHDTVTVYRGNSDGTYQPFTTAATDDAGRFSLRVVRGSYKLVFSDADGDGGASYVGEALGGGDAAYPDTSEVVDVGAAGAQVDVGLGAPTSSQSTPRVVGTPTVGVPVSVDPGSWSATCGALDYGYAWYLDDDTDPFYVGPGLVPDDSLVGKRLVVDVIASSKQCRSLPTESAASAPVAPRPRQAPVPVTAVPSGTAVVSTFSFAGATVAPPAGKAKVGGTLTAPGLNGVPGGASVSYQWYRITTAKKTHKLVMTAIGGATRSTYRVSRRDKGAQVVVAITVSAPQYTKTTATSTKVKVR